MAEGTAQLIGYVDPEKDLGDWLDGPSDDTLRDHLLQVAHQKVMDWEPAPKPERAASYKYAQVLLVKHLWARKQAGDGVGFGADGYMVQTYPLVREARDAVRPSPFAGLL